MSGNKGDSCKGCRMSDVLLSVEDISIVFGGLRAVGGFSCELKAGELVGLIGPNGAGKTTVFNMLSGVYTPTEGSICFTDARGRVHSVHTKKPFQLSKIGIARTFQNIRLFGNLSVFENVALGMHSAPMYSLAEAFIRTPRARRAESSTKAIPGGPSAKTPPCNWLPNKKFISLVARAIR